MSHRTGCALGAVCATLVRAVSPGTERVADHRVTMVWEWVSTASISPSPRRRDGWFSLAFTGGTLDATLKFSMHLGTLGKGDLSNQEWKGKTWPPDHTCDSLSYRWSQWGYHHRFSRHALPHGAERRVPGGQGLGTRQLPPQRGESEAVGRQGLASAPQTTGFLPGTVQWSSGEPGLQSPHLREDQA